MEIAPVPHRSPPKGRDRWVLVLLALAPVTMLAFVPTVLGLERYVLSNDSMGGHLGRGALVLERQVPANDLKTGDVITFRPPAPYDRSGLVTHRIVSIEDGRAVTRGDANPAADPWLLEADHTMRPRLLFSLPWVGYPFLGDVGRWFWLALAVGAAGIIVTVRVVGARRRPARTTEHMSVI